ncbi:MFS transporter [Streptomyces sp. VNUA24]|uniref:MFS transporter n=1 Tax=Streptomyces sp. VNUA24 TaxID=3031131 RepID=UPI0023B7BBF4|nr:MFS transporter [Streptomyces sp. VNUA24]WEH18443.1 MFS transporter [Streptomyces sp. VNUA24]
MSQQPADRSPLVPASHSDNPSEPSTDRGLRSRNFLLFFVARGAGKLGEAMLPVALSAGLLQQGMGASEVGLMLAAHFVCFAGFIIFAGVLSDRFDNRLLMTSANVVTTATQAAVAVMFFSGHLVLWQLAAVMALSGIAAGLFEPGVARTVPAVAEDVQAANGAIRTAESLALLAGPAVAGVLVAVASAALVFTAQACTYIISAVCLLLLRLPVRGRHETFTTSAYRIALVEGWREFRARPWMWATIVLWMVLMLTVWGPLIPLTSSELISAYDARTYGFINAALGGGTALGALIAMRIRPTRPLLVGSVAMLGLVCFPTAVGLQLPAEVISAGAVLSGAGVGCWSVMWETSVQTHVPRPVLGRTKAFEAAGAIIMVPVGQTLAGPAAALVGTRTMLVISGAMVLVVCIALLTIRPIRGLRRADTL